MSALSATQALSVQGGVQDIATHPVLASTTIYKGAMVGITAAGYARGFVAGDQFAGHSLELVDNSAGASAAVRVQVMRGSYRLTVATFDSETIANFGDAVGAGSDNHTDLTLTTVDQVGVVSDVNDNGTVVDFLTSDVSSVNASSTDAVGTVAAAGSAQGDATALGDELVQVVTGGDDTKGVVLPSAAANAKKVVVLNSGSAGLKVYPNTDDKINNGSADAAVAILENTTATFWAVAADNWAAQYTANS